MPPLSMPQSALRSFSTLHRTARTASRFAQSSARRPRTVQPLSSSFRRLESTSATDFPSLPTSKLENHQRPKIPAHAPNFSKQPKPEYEMTFTCKPCSTRSTHRISKQGYHHGSVLITCPGCRNRHIISDHLNIFGDQHMTIEDLMRERGQLVKKGTLSEDGDLEFWEDGTTTKRSTSEQQNTTTAAAVEAPKGPE